MTTVPYSRQGPIAGMPLRYARSHKGWLLGCVAIGSMLLGAAGSAAPLTLDEAIRQALQRNQQMKVSAFSGDIARAQVLAQYGAFDPALTFSRTTREDESPGSLNPLATQLTKTDDYSLTLNGYTPWGMTYSLGGSATSQRGTFNAFSDRFVTFAGVTVTQPLLRGFGFSSGLYGLRVAKADRGIADWQHRQTVIDTVTSVILVYNNLVQAQDSLRIARMSRDLAMQLYEQNVRRNEIGSTSDAEVVQARARVANREEQILFAERNVRDIENQLRLLVGETAFAPDGASVEVEPLPPATPIAINPAQDLKLAYELRPDYQAARLGVDKRRYDAALARNQLLPQLDFVGSYGYSGTDPDFGAARAQVRNRDNQAYSAGVVVSVPIFFAEGRGRARAARLSLRQGEADLARIEADIALAIATAAGQLETTRARVAATRAARDLANQALEAEQKRFTAGTTTTFFVLQFQESLIDVETRYFRALADERRAIANYERETGTTLRTRNIVVE